MKNTDTYCVCVLCTMVWYRIPHAYTHGILRLTIINYLKEAQVFFALTKSPKDRRDSNLKLI